MQQTTVVYFQNLSAVVFHWNDAFLMYANQVVIEIPIHHCWIHRLDKNVFYISLHYILGICLNMEIQLQSIQHLLFVPVTKYLLMKGKEIVRSGIWSRASCNPFKRSNHLVVRALAGTFLTFFCFSSSSWLKIINKNHKSKTFKLKPVCQFSIKCVRYVNKLSLEFVCYNTTIY